MTQTKRGAIVTGGAQGIGKGIVAALLEGGYAVCIADIDDEAGRQACEAYTEQGEVIFVRTDVACEDDVRACVDQTCESFGGLSALVNNAGGGMLRCPVEELSLEDWNRILGANMTGGFLFAKHAAPHLRATQGAIVNIASTRALQSEPGTEAYSASKGGVVALTHALAVSLGPDVRVNCISPGWIEVGDWKKAGACTAVHHTGENRLQHPVGRVGVPQDIASLAAYLLSDRAGFITGQNFVVDGGMTRKMIYVE